AANVNHIHAPELWADPADNPQDMELDLVTWDDDGNLVRRVIKLCSCHYIHRFLAHAANSGCLVCRPTLATPSALPSRQLVAHSGGRSHPEQQLAVQVVELLSHAFGGEQAPVAFGGSQAERFGKLPVMPELMHGGPQRCGIAGRDHQSGLPGDIDIAGTCADLAGDHRLAEHGPFQQGYAKSFGAQMGWEYDHPAELQQDVLLGIGQGA